MASGRVGGTKSKVSGQIGTEIYSVRRNADGSYSQVVSAKPESVRYTNTDKQAAQRMVTGMIEGLMKGLRKIGTISMQAGVNKSKSLNAFSSFNLQRVNADMKANWYNSQNFLYPFKRQGASDYAETGGHWLISSGTLHFNLYDFEGEDDYPEYWFRPDPWWGYSFYGIKFYIDSAWLTIGDFLKGHKITRLDTIVYCFWEDSVYPIGDEGDAEEFQGFGYCVCTVNPYLSDGAPLTTENLKALFLIDHNRPLFFERSGDPAVEPLTPLEHPDFLAVGRMCNRWDVDEAVGYQAAFSISYLDGKRKVSCSEMHYPDSFYPGEYMVNPPTKVFGSWVGDYWNRHYPSPFE